MAAGRSCALAAAGLACSLLVPPPAFATPDPVLAGVARGTFDLPRGVPLAGYSRRRGAASRGVHDPVGVRALILRRGQTTIALVSCDLLLVDERLVAAVRERLSRRGVGVTQLLVAATHTHSGPGGYGSTFLEKLSMGHFDPGVFDRLAAHIVETIAAASTQRVPVRVAVASGRLPGWVTNRLRADGAVDDELVVVVCAREAEETPFAVLVGFAAHPTTLGAWNRELSADYPGVLVQEMERRLPGATCLFFAGAVGDQAPAKQGGGFEPAVRLGAALADEVLRLMARAQPALPSTLAGIQREIALPPARVRLGSWLTLPRWLGRRLADDDATVSAVRLGGLVWFGVPCDLTAELGGRLKAAARARGWQPFIVGFANDYIGYCLPATLDDSGAYEASLALNGPDAGEQIVGALLELLGELSDDAS